MQCGLNPACVAAPIMFIFFSIFGVIFFGVFLFKIFLWWRIFSKAGYSGAFSLLILAPFGVLIMLCVLAFSDWPVKKKAEQQV